MKAVIFAGGQGMRLREETELRPNPMIEIGGRPILWHILKLYSHHGINDFVICLGYLGHTIKDYFANYMIRRSDVTIDLRTQRVEVHGTDVEPWSVTLVDTGLDTTTGGRLRRIRQHLPSGESFCLTYGDGLGDVDIQRAIESHKTSGVLATMTIVRPPGRYGAVQLDGNRIADVREKPRGTDSDSISGHGDGGWINGGFFVMEPAAIDYIGEDEPMFEEQPLRRLAADRQLNAFRHAGYWQCMDTFRDKRELETAWASVTPPWRVWESR